jgi:hypothetical protein
MDSIKIQLERCYGIKKLSAEFDFKSRGNVFAIYAPNGVMKTSFANTFKDYSKGSKTQDRIWPEKETVRIITDENGNEISPNNIFVVEPYNQEFRSEKLSILLVNDELRQKYEAIHGEIDQKADALVAELKPRTGLKTDIREQLAEAITHDKKEFYLALGRVKDEVINGEESSFGDVIYSHIYNKKVLDILGDPEFRSKLRAYIQKYEELLGRSTFFKKGVFSHNNAADVAKSLNNNGFFKADHSVYLRINGEKQEVSSLQDLETAIQTEKDYILTDENLKKAFEAIDKQLNKNAELKTFRDCLERHPVILTELINPDRLKQKLWVAYLIRLKDKFNELLDAFNAGKNKIAEIIEEAKGDRTKWAEVISIFNERFSVPFVVRMDNQVDVILRSEAPTISFDFLEDSVDRNSASASVEESSLMQVLSNGEKRALYILNIIFEVEARRSSGQKTLFIIDDIADSFDYKNKYAIIEYLKEVSDDTDFRQIILSHNFDFYRTVSGRLDLKREARLFASKTSEQISLNEELYQRSPFSHWKKNLNKPEMLIAAIPFLRNLAEYSGNQVVESKLTSLLHLKADTEGITVKDLENIAKKVLHDHPALQLPNPDKKVIDLVYEVADSIVANPTDSHNLELKVVLSIAIRLKAEAAMIKKINNPTFCLGIKSNQTISLIKRYRHDFPSERSAILLFEQVNLMTPENIHLNSFMYEPILDLSAQHLKKLYAKLNSLVMD